MFILLQSPNFWGVFVPAFVVRGHKLMGQNPHSSFCGHQTITSGTCSKIQTHLRNFLALQQARTAAFPHLEKSKYHILRAVLLDPRAAVEEREVDVCLIYKHLHTSTNDVSKKETASTQKEFPALLQLPFRWKH